MSSESPQARQVSVPELLRRGLEIRLGAGKRYVISDSSTGRKVVLSDSEFFILNHLCDHDALEELEEEYLAVFSAPLAEGDLNHAIGVISAANFWGRLARHHPVISSRLPEQPALAPNQRRRGAGQRRRQRAGMPRLGHSKPGQLGKEAGNTARSGANDPNRGLLALDSGNANSDAAASGEQITPVDPLEGEYQAATNEPDGEEPIVTVLPGSAAHQAGRRTKADRPGGRQQPPGGRSKSIFPQIKLFNPVPLLDSLMIIVGPVRKLLLWAVPALLITAAFIVDNHIEIISKEFGRIMGSLSFVARAAVGLVTVNLLSTFGRGLAARHFGMKIHGFGIRLILYLLPRFIVAAAIDPAAPRAHRAWVAGMPLLVKLFLAGAGMVFWYLSRADDSGLSFFWFWLAFMGLASFILTAIPLIPASGYQVLCIVLDEPELRKKAFGSLKSGLTGKPFPQGGGLALAIFGLSTLVFMVLLLGFIFYIIGTVSKLYFSTTGITVSVLFIAFLLYQLYRKTAGSPAPGGARQSGQLQLGRNSQRARPAEGRGLRAPRHQAAAPIPLKADQPSGSSGFRWFRYLVIAALIGAMFLPYSYETGGQLLIKPLDYQEVTTDFGGIIEEVYFNGGETIKAGTLIAQLSSADAKGQMNIYEARIKEQQADIDRLLAKPEPEQLELAEKALEVEQTKAAFSKKNLVRKEKIFKQQVISEEEVQEAQRQYQVDQGNVREAEANVALVKAGATPEELLAAEAELQRWIEERNLARDRYEKSSLYMPIDGKLISMYLKQRTGQYLNMGEAFAVVENTSSVLGEIEVPEFDTGIIKLGSEVRVRVWAYHNEVFVGKVKSIDTNVEERSFGSVVKVVTLLDNSDQRLKTGMTGYAKISGETRPVWQVLFLTILRFVQVEMWSWIP